MTKHSMTSEIANPSSKKKNSSLFAMAWHLEAPYRIRNSYAMPSMHGIPHAITPSHSYPPDESHINQALKKHPIESTLFIIVSKSGTTIEIEKIISTIATQQNNPSF